MSIEIEKKARLSEENYLEVCKLIQEKYGVPSFVEKTDIYYRNLFAANPEEFTFRLRKISNSVWKSNDSGKYELCSKVRETLDDGTEVNKELETEISVKDTEAFKAALKNVGIGFFYNKIKNGLEWMVPLKFKKHPFSLHVEVFRVTSDNGYKDFFIEVEYTGDCEVDLETNFVIEKIDDLLKNFGCTEIEPKKYQDLILALN